MAEDKLVERFIELVKVASPSGQEKAMSDWLSNYFNKLNWEVWPDNAGEIVGSDTGNVYAYLEVNPQAETVLALAHMDTVQEQGDEIVPVVRDGTITSQGNTILGADNKLGVAILCEIAAQIDMAKLKSNLLFFFPVREEAGLMGSSCFSFTRTPIKYALNIDGAGVGNITTQALGQLVFSIVVRGKAAHAAMNYDKGINAIAVASELIQSLPQGNHHDPYWTLNIGKITGGRGTNVVSDSVILEGELRAFDDIQMKKVQDLVTTACGKLEQKYQTQIVVTFKVAEKIPPLQAPKGDLVELIAEIGNAGKQKLTFANMYASSDANFISAKAIDVVCVSRAGEFPHSVDESVNIADFLVSYQLISEILSKLAAR